MFPILTATSTWDIDGSLTTIGTIVEKMLDVIKSNPILTTIFVAGLIPAGFMVIRKAKKASKA